MVMTRDEAHAEIVPILSDITGEIGAAHAVAHQILDAIWVHCDGYDQDDEPEEPWTAATTSQ